MVAVQLKTYSLRKLGDIRKISKLHVIIVYHPASHPASPPAPRNENFAAPLKT